MEAEGCLVDIERSSCDGNDVTAMDGVLQQAEWLLRDVLFEYQMHAGRPLD